MIDLVYPYDLAPVLPAPTADSLPQAAEGVEYFPIVEPNGLVIGRSSREYCHGGAKPLHPVIHIHIIDRMSRVYLQKRSMKKDIQPDWIFWQLSVIMKKICPFAIPTRPG